MSSLRLAATCALSLALLGSVIALAFAGDDGGEAPSSEPAVIGDLQGFTCADWQRSGPAERSAVLGELREVIGGQVTGGGVAGRGTVLTDDEATRLFDAHCRRPYAAGFVLYKLYGQAAGFAGVAP